MEKMAALHQQRRARTAIPGALQLRKTAPDSGPGPPWLSILCQGPPRGQGQRRAPPPTRQRSAEGSSPLPEQASPEADLWTSPITTVTGSQRKTKKSLEQFPAGVKKRVFPGEPESGFLGRMDSSRRASLLSTFCWFVLLLLWVSRIRTR